MLVVVLSEKWEVVGVGLLIGMISLGSVEASLDLVEREGERDRCTPVNCFFEGRSVHSASTVELKVANNCHVKNCESVDRLRALWAGDMISQEALMASGAEASTVEALTQSTQSSHHV